MLFWRNGLFLSWAWVGKNLRNTEIKSLGCIILPPPTTSRRFQECWQPHGEALREPREIKICGKHPGGSGSSPRSSLAQSCPCRRGSSLCSQNTRRSPPPGCSTDLGERDRVRVTGLLYCQLASEQVSFTTSGEK